MNHAPSFRRTVECLHSKGPSEEMVYGEAMNMSKRKAAKQRFCEWAWFMLEAGDAIGQHEAYGEAMDMSKIKNTKPAGYRRQIQFMEEI